MDQVEDGGAHVETEDGGRNPEGGVPLGGEGPERRGKRKEGEKKEDSRRRRNGKKSE